MKKPRPNLPAYAWRRVLASTAEIGPRPRSWFWSAESAGTSRSSVTHQVDFGKTGFFPRLKSKIGVGRALNSEEILGSLPYMDDICRRPTIEKSAFPTSTLAKLAVPFLAGRQPGTTKLPVSG